jgi:hypothetical protein
MKRNLKNFAVALLFASFSHQLLSHDVGESSRAWEGTGCQQSADKEYDI